MTRLLGASPQINPMPLGVGAPCLQPAGGNCYGTNYAGAESLPTFRPAPTQNENDFLMYSI
jgi:hypothetical protein